MLYLKINFVHLAKLNPGKGVVMSISSPECLVVVNTDEDRKRVNEAADELRKSFRFGLFDVEDTKEGVVFSRCVEHNELPKHFSSLGFKVMKETWVFID